MLFIVFRIGEQPHALDASQIETVTPALPLRAIPGTSRGIVGVFEHQGRVVPVVDLSLAIQGVPSRHLLSSRYLIVGNAGPRPIALLAEHVTETLEVDESKLQPSGVISEGAPFLGEVFRDDDGSIVQCVSPQSLLPQEVLASLEIETEEPTP